MRQLSLFKGKRQKGERLPPAIEFRVHVMIADMLRLSISPGWLWMHYPAGENRDAITGARLKRMGTKPGVSDLLLVSPAGGRLHALELKRKGSKPSPEQMAFLEAVRAAGGVSAWVDDFDGAVAQLAAWGAIRVVP